MDWEAIAVPTEPILELIVRGTIVYVALLVALRTVGQRDVGGLGVTDVLVIVLLAQAVGGGLVVESTAVTDGLILVFTFLFWSVAIDALAYRFPRFARLVNAQPRELIVNGRTNRQVSRRGLMTDDEIQTQLRLHGIEDINDVRHAYLEPNGMVSVIRHDGDVPDDPVKQPGV